MQSGGEHRLGPGLTEKAAEAEEVEFPEFAVAPAELANHSVNDIVQVAASERDRDAARRRGSTPRTARPVTAKSWRAVARAARAEPYGSRLAVLRRPSADRRRRQAALRRRMDRALRHPQRASEVARVWKPTWSPTCRSSGTTTTRRPTATERFLTDEEIDEVAEYVMQISGQQVTDRAKAERGRVLFLDRANCFDCHGDDATGNPALGSTNLTKPELYLFGSDRATDRRERSTTDAAARCRPSKASCGLRRSRPCRSTSSGAPDTIRTRCCRSSTRQKQNGEQVSLLAVFISRCGRLLARRGLLLLLRDRLQRVLLRGFGARHSMSPGSTKGCGSPGLRFLSSTARSSTPPPG